MIRIVELFLPRRLSQTFRGTVGSLSVLRGSFRVPAALEWNPADVIAHKGSYGLIVLNQPLIGSKDHIASVWNNARFRATADGGTNEWNSFLTRTSATVQDPVPNLVTGDFDSADAELVYQYQKLGALVIETPDQDETDYTKCVRCLSDEVHRRKIQLDYVLTIVEASGRLDQIMANINTLFTGPKILNMPLYQLCSDSLSWVLEPGHHRIHVDNSLFHRWCGLIPVQGPARVTTKGLKWDLDGHKLQFGALVSTSNQWTEARVVTLETDRAILITTGHGE